MEKENQGVQVKDNPKDYDRLKETTFNEYYYTSQEWSDRRESETNKSWGF